MAEPSGMPHICCTDTRPAHGQKVAASGVCSQFCPPAIITNCFIGWIPEVIYRYFFCDFAITQQQNVYWSHGRRRVYFYVHCHCDRPYSLQCIAARQSMIFLLAMIKLELHTESLIRSPRLCCDTWRCSPLAFLGAIRCTKYHCYFFKLGFTERSRYVMWPSCYCGVCVRINPSLAIVVMFCQCIDTPERCAMMCERVYNVLRMFLCCCSSPSARRIVSQTKLSGIFE
ncbi:E4.2 protein [Psittacine adenovirus 3]|uniref:E4.2 protein n=1 Tax=Psittacine adenovirus 3 TaxID=1580497 RepID=A0A0A7JT23_9ADEN|nr:E4.2 protein [Psittacine adenovirus 3]AIZ35783.1 E4.2 protein [Psittacine adenovirus 3]